MNEDSTIQNKQIVNPAGFGWENDGDAIPIVDFDFLTLDELSESAEAKCFASGAIAMLKLINAGATPERAGKRARLISFALGQGDCSTQGELAAKLGISQAAVNQGLLSVRNEIARMKQIFLKPGDL